MGGGGRIRGRVGREASVPSPLLHGVVRAREVVLAPIPVVRQRQVGRFFIRVHKGLQGPVPVVQHEVGHADRRVVVEPAAEELLRVGTVQRTC